MTCQNKRYTRYQQIIDGFCGPMLGVKKAVQSATVHVWDFGYWSPYQWWSVHHFECSELLKPNTEICDNMRKICTFTFNNSHLSRVVQLQDLLSAPLMSIIRYFTRNPLFTVYLWNGLLLFGMRTMNIQSITKIQISYLSLEILCPIVSETCLAACLKSLKCWYL